MRFLERNLWSSLLVLAVLAATLLAVALRLGGGMPALKPYLREGEPLRDWPLPDRLAGWFSTNALLAALPTNANVNPFFTLHFQPPGPPPTRRVELLYMGNYTSSRSNVFAYLQLGDKLLVLTNGAVVVADHAIQQITLKEVVLTNAAGVTNVLPFNVKKPLEVPAR
ncbi:MAG: hypothetical protein IPM17_05780 [Verrucomicrobia bacterium]|nr:hypothetical protein [Verrucomicrobiota bacterium]